MSGTGGARWLHTAYLLSVAVKAKADRLATEIGREFVSFRGRSAPDYLDVDGSITPGLAFDGIPVVMADPADNAGGGAPSANTTILRRPIERAWRALSGWRGCAAVWRLFGAKPLYDPGWPKRLHGARCRHRAAPMLWAPQRATEPPPPSGETRITPVGCGAVRHRTSASPVDR
jgi:hypothetical protein